MKAGYRCNGSNWWLPLVSLPHEYTLFIKRTAKWHLRLLGNTGFNGLDLPLNVYSGNKIKAPTVYINDRVQKQHYPETPGSTRLLGVCNGNHLFLPACYLLSGQQGPYLPHGRAPPFSLGSLGWHCLYLGQANTASASPTG